MQICNLNADIHKIADNPASSKKYFIVWLPGCFNIQTQAPDDNLSGLFFFSSLTAHLFFSQFLFFIFLFIKLTGVKETCQVVLSHFSILISHFSLLDLKFTEFAIIA